MALPTALTTIADHLAALQLLINRCPSAELRKSLIVDSAMNGAIHFTDADLLIQANQLETA